MTLAFELGKTRSEILSMSKEDFEYALAYMKLSQEEAEKARKRQNMKSSNKGRRF